MLITESFNSQLDDLLERICVKLQISSTQLKPIFFQESVEAFVPYYLEASETKKSA